MYNKSTFIVEMLFHPSLLVSLAKPIEGSQLASKAGHWMSLDQDQAAGGVLTCSLILTKAHSLPSLADGKVLW